MVSICLNLWTCWQILSLTIITLLIAYKVYIKYAFDNNISLKGKVILVTGCDTGFGNKIAKKLDSLGATVFATCLQHKTCAKLNSETSDNVTTVIMDVTNTIHINNIASDVSKYLNKHQTYLYGIVNNAGVAECSPFECIPAKLFNKVINVNMFGVSNVLREFLPLMRNKKYNPYLFDKKSSKNMFGLGNRGKAGRIVNIASIAGRVAGPYLTAYHASKHAVIGFTDSLRYELQKLFNIWTCTVEPSFTNTPLLRNGVNSDAFADKWKSISQDSGLGNLIRRNEGSESNLVDNDSETQSPAMSPNASMNNQKGSLMNNNDIMGTYDIDNWIKWMENESQFIFRVADDDSSRVVNCVIAGLASRFPLRWYYPNWQAKFLAVAKCFLPMFVRDFVVESKFFNLPIVK